MFRLVLLSLMVAGFSLATPSAAEVSAAETVNYRCKEWKAKHIHDKKAADTIEKTLKTLKCETQRHAHNGHDDLKYRCVEWKTLQLKTHEEAHKWESWLKEYGFETQHKH
ncbi:MULTISPECIES: hypothetical protein [Rhodopirellula]|uniref:Signal peptide and transmembrane protein n=1 Tax=Rhodopirellula islandica TaxID=595434 RepID=A0A0J1B436_RHOIS|nr:MULTISPECIES: hypothetical protein [Rhodopirellula]KLU01373.1 putative signal peptide and transmembrane protein [Rhodopirellula islandica]WDQ16172.1 hypothetical protein PSR62_21455 [Rhodopirellula sp. P2]